MARGNSSVFKISRFFILSLWAGTLFLSSTSWGFPLVKPPAPVSTQVRCESLLLSTARFDSSSGRSFTEGLKLYFTADKLEELTWQSQTSAEENAEWIALNQVGDTSRHVAFVFEVPVVKQMNDGILVGHKRLVNVLLNFLKSTLKSQLLQVLPPGLSVHWYSDFKTLGLLIDQPANGISELALRSLVMQATRESLSRFEHLVGLTAPHMGFYRSVNPHSWIKVGGGQTPQFASVAARLARYMPAPENLKPQPVIWFHDDGQYYLAAGVLPELEVRRALVIDFLSRHFPNLLMKTSDSEVDAWKALRITTLHPEVFKSLRSAKSAEDFLELMVLKFPQLKSGLEKFVAQQVWNYFQLQNQLSPPVYFRDRKYASLANGDVGGASFDFVGLGALNSMAVDLALSEYFRYPTEPANLILLIQKRESELTAFVHEQRNLLDETVKEILTGLGGEPGESVLSCSADDCAVSFFAKGEATVKEVFERSLKVIDPLLRKLNSHSVANFRIVMIGNSSTPPGQKDTLVGHGEVVEKKWRHRLYQLGLGSSDQASLHAVFVMRGVSAGLGAVDIYYVTKAPGAKALHQLMEEALFEVLADTNMELGTSYEKGSVSTLPKFPFL